MTFYNIYHSFNLFFREGTVHGPGHGPGQGPGLGPGQKGKGKVVIK